MTADTTAHNDNLHYYFRTLHPPQRALCKRAPFITEPGQVWVAEERLVGTWGDRGHLEFSIRSAILCRGGHLVYQVSIRILYIFTGAHHTRCFARLIARETSTIGKPKDTSLSPPEGETESPLPPKTVETYPNTNAQTKGIESQIHAASCCSR